MIKLPKLKILALSLMSVFTILSCDDSSTSEELMKSECSDINFEITFSDNETIKSLDYRKTASAYIPIIEGAKTYEWTVNGIVVEGGFITPSTFSDIDPELTKLIPDNLKNLAFVSFDRFKDAEVTVTVKTDECIEGATKTSIYTKTPEFSYCDPIDFHIDLTKDAKSVILNLEHVLGSLQSTWTVKEFNDKGDVVNTTVGTEVFNYTTTFNVGVVEICADVKTSGCSEGRMMCKKIIFSEETVNQIKKDYEEHYKTKKIEHISLRLDRNDDGTYTPRYTFK